MTDSHEWQTRSTWVTRFYDYCANSSYGRECLNERMWCLSWCFPIRSLDSWAFVRHQHITIIRFQFLGKQFIYSSHKYHNETSTQNSIRMSFRSANTENILRYFLRSVCQFKEQVVRFGCCYSILIFFVLSLLYSHISPLWLHHQARVEAK